jgi:hypothetical protein
MTAGPAHDVGTAGHDRAQAPIRWPRPDGPTLVLIAIWVIGLLVALVVPALIVPPNATHPNVGRTWFAFLFTVLGAAIMLGVSLTAFRRTRDGTTLTFGGVAAISVFLGGIILVATKLGGGYGQS